MIWDDILQAIPRDQWGTFQAGAMYGAAMTAAGSADMALGAARCEVKDGSLSVPLPDERDGSLSVPIPDLLKPPPLQDEFICPRCGEPVPRDRISLHPAHQQDPPWNTGFEWVGSCPHCEKSRLLLEESDFGVRGITIGYLVRKGYDGLYNDDLQCGCEIADLMPCTEPSPYCRPGVKSSCDCGEGDWYIVRREEDKT